MSLYTDNVNLPGLMSTLFFVTCCWHQLDSTVTSMYRMPMQNSFKSYLSKECRRAIDAHYFICWFLKTAWTQTLSVIHYWFTMFYLRYYKEDFLLFNMDKQQWRQHSTLTTRWLSFSHMDTGFVYSVISIFFHWEVLPAIHISMVCVVF